jgi:hypothetical protein
MVFVVAPILGRARPHPACLDGEADGELTARHMLHLDPIRLVRMVKQIAGY